MATPIPPPPYSETDVFSNSGSSGAPLAIPISSRYRHSSVSSSVESTIYTPPYTPDGSYQQSDQAENAAVGPGAFAAPPLTTRSTCSRPSAEFRIHQITLDTARSPSDLAYPQPEQDWLERDVSKHDWATFVNYLLPEHSANSNEQVADRKLKAELLDERMQRLTIENHDRRRRDIGAVVSNLSALRTRDRLQEPMALGGRRAVLERWNKDFFQPRGLYVTDDSDLGLTGAPPQQASSSSPRAATCGGNTPREHGLRGGVGIVSNIISALKDTSNARVRRLPASGWSFERSDTRHNKQGNEIGIDGPRSEKHGTVLDRNGIRMSNDIDDQDVCARRGGRGRRGEHHGHGRHRGRGHHYGHRSRGHGRRSSSTSSSSSDSSTSTSSSSSSDDSVDSLPRLDKLDSKQIGVATSSLMDWLGHPDQPVTSAHVRDLKFDLKASVGSLSSGQSLERNAMSKKEVKALMRSVKGLMRVQREQRRALKREQRANRRAVRRERKEERKSIRRAERQAKKEEKRARRHGKGLDMHLPHSPATQLLSRQESGVEDRHAAARTPSGAYSLQDNLLASSPVDGFRGRPY